MIAYEAEVADEQGGAPLCENCVKLLSAETEDEARAKAEEIGRSGEVAYTNEAGAVVRWKFLGVLEVQDLCEATIYDGIEVWSRMYWGPADGRGRDEPNAP